MSQNSDPIQTLPLRDIPSHLTKSATAGSAANQEMIQSLSIRLCREALCALEQHSISVSSATSELSETIRGISATNENTSRELVRLNCHLATATWVMAALTLALVCLGAIQFFLK